VTYDERRLRELLEESQDLHSRGMRLATEGLREYTEVGLERRARGDVAAPGHGRRTFLRRSLFAAGAVGTGVGAGFLRRAVITVEADAASDITMLQTAAAIENLAIGVYNTAATLPPSVTGASNPVIAQFVTTTIAQHTDHSRAFNAAITKLGGKPQTGPDTAVQNAVVAPALPKIHGPSDVLGLAYTLEDAAAATYVKFGSQVDDRDALGALASIAPVEAQHASVILASKALVDAGAPELIAIPPDLTKLPAAAGAVGFPDTFYKTDHARPADEGKVA
jgi:rubrerythrin